MTTKQEQLDQFMSCLGEQELFNGVILVADQGEVIYKAAFGLAERETNRPLTTESVFELASVSKPFTAMGIMRLKEQGKLSYDDPVERWIPDFPYSGITIRQLLQHTSGLPDYETIFIEKWDRSKIAVNQDVLDMLSLHKPPVRFQPNEKWEYSNIGYVIMAIIIEKASGLSFEAFMKTDIFDTIGMNDTRIYNRRYKPDRIPDYAYGYLYSFETGQYMLPDHTPDADFVVYLDGIQGDGTVNSNVGDLFLWDRALYTEQLVSRGTLEEAFAPTPLSVSAGMAYGFGWIVEQDENKGTVVSHSGGWPGYFTMLKRFIDGEKTLIYLSNSDKQTDFQLQILEQIENILFAQPFTIPQPPAPFEAVEIDTAIYERYAGRYRLPEADIVTVSVDKGRLYIHSTGLQTYELLPLSETRFFIQATQAELRFVPNENGSQYDLLLDPHNELKAIRID